MSSGLGDDSMLYFEVEETGLPFVCFSFTVSLVPSSFSSPKEGLAPGDRASDRKRLLHNRLCHLKCRDFSPRNEFCCRQKSRIRTRPELDLSRRFPESTTGLSTENAHDFNEVQEFRVQLSNSILVFGLVSSSFQFMGSTLADWE